MRSYSIAGGKEGCNHKEKVHWVQETVQNQKQWVINENGKGITKKEQKAMEAQFRFRVYKIRKLKTERSALPVFISRILKLRLFASTDYVISVINPKTADT